MPPIDQNRRKRLMIVELDDDFLRTLPAPDRVIEFRDAREESLILRVFPTGELAYFMEWSGRSLLPLGHPPIITVESARRMARTCADVAGAVDGYASDLRTLEAWERFHGPLALN